MLHFGLAKKFKLKEMSGLIIYSSKNHWVANFMTILNIVFFFFLFSFFLFYNKEWLIHLLVRSNQWDGGPVGFGKAFSFHDVGDSCTVCLCQLVSVFYADDWSICNHFVTKYENVKLTCQICWRLWKERKGPKYTKEAEPALFGLINLAFIIRIPLLYEKHKFLFISAH